MSFITLKAQIDAQITSKESTPQSVGATEVGQNMDDIIDEVVAAFGVLNGGTLPADQDTLLKIANKIIAINTQLGSSGTTIDAINTALGLRDTASTVDTKIATAVNGLINGAPGLIDTLNEVAQALGNDPDFAATMMTLLNGKEPSILNKKDAFNQAFGTGANDVARGNHTHNTDSLVEGAKKFFSETLTRATILTGLTTGTATTLDAADSILVAFGKIRKWITDFTNALANKANLVSGKVPLSELPVVNIALSFGAGIEEYDTGAVDGDGLPIMKLRVSTAFLESFKDENMITNRLGYWTTFHGQATIYQQNANTVANIGTVTARTFTSLVNFIDRSPRVGIVGAAAAVNNTASLRCSRHEYTLQQGFETEWQYSYSDGITATTKNWSGLTADANQFSGTAEPSTRPFAALGIGNDTDETTYSIISGPSGAIVKTPLGANFPVDTDSIFIWKVVAVRGASSVQMTVKRLDKNSGAELASTTVNLTGAQLPGATTPMIRSIWRSTGTTSGIPVLEFFWGKFKFNYAA